MKKVLKIINNIILICLIIILLSISYSRFVKKEEMVTLLGKGFLVIITESMSPTIESGDFIVISKEECYEEGDIITYLDNTNMIVTHRIVEITGDKFVAKGDNNNLADKEADIERIYGKVILKSSVLGFFVLYLLKPFLVIYIIYLVVSEIIFIYKDKKKNKEEDNELDDEENKNIEKENENEENTEKIKEETEECE